MNDPIPFLYQGDKLVRVVIGPDREPWFVATDLCRDLGIKNVSQAVERLDKDEKGICETYTLGGKQGVSIVSESGFYTLAIRSNRPEAVEFRRWITHEVLPSIRRTGGYQIAGDRADKAFSKKLHEVRLVLAELRRAYGPAKAAKLGVDLWAKVGVIIDDPRPLQGDLLVDDNEPQPDNVVDIGGGADR